MPAPIVLALLLGLGASGASAQTPIIVPYGSAAFSWEAPVLKAADYLEGFK